MNREGPRTPSTPHVRWLLPAAAAAWLVVGCASQPKDPPKAETTPKVGVEKPEATPQAGVEKPEAAPRVEGVTRRKAYVTAGHGEITNPDSVPPDLKGRVPERRTTVFKKRLADLHYEVKDLGLIELAKDVPDDATIVIMLAPSVPLQPAEWDALGRYLDRGGRLMIALDPMGDPGLGSLEGKLGLKYNPGHLTDDREYLPQRGTLADRRFVITSQFSAHASTTALSRSVGKGLVLIDAGALEDVPFTTKGTAPTRTVTIRSGESSWLDLDNNFVFDGKTEKRQRWNLGAAIEGPKDGAKDGFRALVFSDADLFADALVQSQMGRASVVLVSGPLLDDSVRWLGGEERF